jgi:hypothetical protein
MKLNKRYSIKISQRRIRDSIQGNHKSCVVANAIRCAIKAKHKTKDVFVSVLNWDDSVWINGVRYSISQRMMEYIGKFDENKKKVRPTSFVVKKVCG